MKSKLKHGSRRKGSSENKNYGTLPSSGEMKNMLSHHKFNSAEPAALLKLKNVFRTYLIKIVKAAVLKCEKLDHHKITDLNVTDSIVELFGIKFAATVATTTSKDEKTFISSKTFNRMLKECLELLVSNGKKPSPVVSTYIHKAAEMALVKGFLSPIRFWHKADADVKGKSTSKTKKLTLTLKLLTRVNQVHFITESEFFSPSLTSMI